MENLEKKSGSLIYGINDRPPLGDTLFAAVQHLLAIFVAIMTPPLIIADALGMDIATKGYMVSMSLFVSGIATFIQSKRFGILGCGLLCVQGTSFSFIGPIIAIGMSAIAQAKGAGQDAAAVYYGLPLIFGACIAAAPIEMAVSFCFKYLRRVITPLVSGIVVMLIGLSLLRAGMMSFGGGNPSSPDFATPQNLLVASVVLVSVLVFNASSNKYLRMGAIFLGIVVGYVLALCLGMVDFAQLQSAEVGMFYLPQPFKYGVEFNLSSIIAVALVYFVTAIEATGDVTANSMISGEPMEGESYVKRVSGGILADGFNSMLAGVFNSFPNSIFAQNNGIIQLTGVASRYVGYFIAALLVLLGLFPIVGIVFSLMPAPVLGGATLLMFGMVAAAGVRIIASQNLDRRAVLVVATSLAGGLGVELMPNILQHLPEALRTIFASGITTGGVLAIVCNALINIRKKK